MVLQTVCWNHCGQLSPPWYASPQLHRARRGHRRRVLAGGGSCPPALYFLARYRPHDQRRIVVIASTAVGGLLVEVSRRYDASARLVPMRSVVTRACLLVGGPLGGFLATFAFGLSTTICAVVVFLVVPIAMIWLHERAAPKVSVAGMAKCEAPDQEFLHSRSASSITAMRSASQSLFNMETRHSMRAYAVTKSHYICLQHMRPPSGWPVMAASAYS